MAGPKKLGQDPALPPQGALTVQGTRLWSRSCARSGLGNLFWSVLLASAAATASIGGQ